MFKCLLFAAITKTQSWKRKVESGKPGFDPGGVETDHFRQYHKIGKKQMLHFSWLSASACAVSLAG
jgi:hypothetical protein